jgi:hypothetical protein
VSKSQSANSAAAASMSCVREQMPDSSSTSHQLAVDRPPTGTAATLVSTELEDPEQQLHCGQAARQQGDAITGAPPPGAQHAPQLEHNAAKPGCSQDCQVLKVEQAEHALVVQPHVADSGAVCADASGLGRTTGCTGSTQCAWCGRSAVD